VVRFFRSSLLFLSLSLTVLALATAYAATTWTQPTPEELKMTSDPKAPDAEAVYLNREETVDDKMHFHRMYVRIKILTEKGKKDYSDFQFPYEAGDSNIRAVEGRTIHSDGTVIPYTGKPYDKELMKFGDTKINVKAFSMPDVQVGSIVEYRWELSYGDYSDKPPQWYIQQSIYVHQAHYHFVPADLSKDDIEVTDALGKQSMAHGILYYPALPPGNKVREGMDGYDLTVSDVPALTNEEYQPPLDSFSYRLLFYYSAQFTGGEFWQNEGKIWSKDVDRFANPSGKIRDAVGQIVAPSDTDDQKLQKIYAAVMKIDNTRFSREHSAQENKAQGLRVKTAADIWEQKRGSDDEITRLFIAMARAAGLKAYAMIVTERDRNLLNTGYLDWSQFEDEIAIVSVGGKEQFFDPGQRYCEYGKLHWMHTQLLGIRQADQGPVAMVTPAGNYQDNTTVRSADVALGADGTVKGTARITMNGVEALRWRQQALRGDEQEMKKTFEDELQGQVPAGVVIRTNHFLGLTEPGSALMAVMDVSGNMGTATGKRIFVPSSLFEANVKPPFAAATRESPIDLHYPYLLQDDVKLELAPGLTVKNLPTDAEVPMLTFGKYRAKYSTPENSYELTRVVAMGRTLFTVAQYGDLRDFYQKMGAQDQQQVLLERTAMTASQ
jgi:hypothetical protein